MRTKSQDEKKEHMLSLSGCIKVDSIIAFICFLLLLLSVFYLFGENSPLVFFGAACVFFCFAENALGNLYLWYLVKNDLPLPKG